MGKDGSKGLWGSDAGSLKKRNYPPSQIVDTILDIVDGAARVCDPFFDGVLTGKHW